ncbi:hypothetical protein L9F63_028113 [Diploptera punctata]|uniref:Glucose dehydrogenase n=1 Tax=Diploptera punctata TaxID=6984 RepID=A0AAD7ZY68_DIPPU|nr:hypothetical protein L9F63_028113 [Diploptera punctata]
MEGSCPAACNAPQTCPGPGASALFFTTLISSLLQSERELADNQMYPMDASNFMLDEYDFIVVGAGTAGSVIASRISEVPQYKVLVIEAGGDPPFLSNIPAMYPSLQKSEMDWQYKPSHKIKTARGW